MVNRMKNPSLLYFVLSLFGIGMSLLWSTVCFYGDSRQLSKFALGVILALPSLSAVIVAPIWGVLSDRSGSRKPFIIAASLIAGFLIMLLGFCGNATSLGVIGFVLYFVIAAIPCLSVPIVTDMSENSKTAIVIGKYASLTGVAAIIGFALSGFLIENLGYTHTFLTAGLLLWLGGMSLLWFKEATFKSKNEKLLVHLIRPFLQLFRHKTFLHIHCITIFLLGVADAVVFAFILLFLDQVIGVSKTTATLVLALGPATRTPAGLLLGRITGKYGVQSVLDLGVSVTPLAYVIIAFSPNVAITAFSLACYGVIWSMYYFGSQLLFVSKVEKEKKGEYIGLFNSSWSLGWLFGTFLAGVLLMRFSFRVTYLFAVLIWFFGAIIYFLYVRPNINPCRK